MAGYIFSAELVEQYRRNPMSEVLRDLGKHARDVHLLATPEFKKLLGYITEVADGRDRREPMTAVAGSHRPQPRLRVLINDAFKSYGDLTWFRMNKIASANRPPLKGAFTRMAASMGRLAPADVALVVDALVHEQPDKKLLKLLNEQGGKIRNCGLELFARLSSLFRPDLYFLIPRGWGDDSGCLKFIGDDLRKYCAVCRTLRQICDDVGFPADVRSVLFDRAVQMEPMHPTLESTINASIGGALAWANVLEPNEGYVTGRRENDSISMPLEVASQAIRVRRGDARLRSVLCRSYRNQCAISGECPKDLLEVAYIAPYPAGDVHSPRNAVPLRADLHTLWDLNLIAVQPDTLEVHIGEKLRGSYFESFAGARLLDPGGANQLDKTALKERWSHFRAGQRKASKMPAEAVVEETVPEVETFAEFEPKKSSSSGIWRVPATAGPIAPSAASRSISAVADVIPMADDEEYGVA